ncbi:ras-GEF domain-containing family member 1B-A-like isoform X2 [Salvelinus alpinus]|uniref:ras-GEF domain-containing family member 1B-A-like isoform X2 n=1 Tax=Salvelinus alpinus TaxID=8036 RepID=UPI0039FD2378
MKRRLSRTTNKLEGFSTVDDRQPSSPGSAGVCVCAWLLSLFEVVKDDQQRCVCLPGFRQCVWFLSVCVFVCCCPVLDQGEPPSSLSSYMAKFLAELLGCTLPDKGTSPGMFQSRSQPHLGLRHASKQRDNMPQTSPLTGMLVSSGYNKNQSQTKEEGLYYHDNTLVSGSLEALIHHLVPSMDYYPDRTYIFTFLLSSRLFIHPYELMSKVCHLCMEQQRLSDPQADKMRIRKLAPKILQLLQEWTETFSYDFRDERMMRSLKELTQRLSSGDELYRKVVHQMIQVLIRKLTTLSQYEEALVKINATATDRLTALKAKPQAIQRDMLSICNDPFTMAQQLTHIELERLSNIEPEEFIQAFEKKDLLDNDKSCFSDQKKASSLEAYVEWFNRLSFLVATEICMPVKKKQRARVMEFFIDVARECFNIGNFNSLMAIISGMNMSPVSRLKKTWSKVKTAKFDILEHQMDPSGNFYNYRTALRGATQRSRTANSTREKIVIPFFSLLIKDIYFLNEGCSNRMQNGHVNFEKFWEMAKRVSEFMVWKKVECPFEKDRKILQYLLTAPVFSEDTLYLASYESEGPENHMEKDRWKSLRSTLLSRV